MLLPKPPVILVFAFRMDSMFLLGGRVFSFFFSFHFTQVAIRSCSLKPTSPPTDYVERFRVFLQESPELPIAVNAIRTLVELISASQGTREHELHNVVNVFGQM